MGVEHQDSGPGRNMNSVVNQEFKGRVRGGCFVAVVIDSCCISLFCIVTV